MSRLRKGLAWTAVIVAGAIAFLAWSVLHSRPHLAGVAVPASAPQATVFADVSVFDGQAMHHHLDVVVSGAEVAAVGPTGRVEVPSGATRVEGPGRTLLPGLIDSHVHLFSAGEKQALPPSADAIAGALLYSGVTTVLVAAGGSEVSELQTARAAGRALAPHLAFAGPGITAPGGHPIPLLRAMLPWPLSTLAVRGVLTADGGAEARRRVDEVKRTTDAAFFKIVYDDLPPGGAPHLSREALISAIDEANARQMRPVVHATTPADVLEAVEAGAALMMHVPQRGRLTPDQLARLAAAATPVVTTVRMISASHDLAARAPSALEREVVDARAIEAWRQRPAWELEGFSEELDERYAEVAADTEANVLALYRAGVPLLVGTDSGVHGVFPGPAIHRELQLLVRLGVAPEDALRAATSVPADFLDPGRGFGRIARGQRADLLLVRGDPTEDIAALEAIDAVYLAGVPLVRRPLPATVR